MILYARIERSKVMESTGDILKRFYDAVGKRDLTTARGYLNDDFLFIGLFETYRSADEYLTALSGLLSVTVRLDVKKIIAQGNDAAVFFELQTKAPAEGTVFLVAEWHQFKNGKIAQVQSAFDGRPYEAMFSGKKYRPTRRSTGSLTLRLTSSLDKKETVIIEAQKRRFEFWVSESRQVIQHQDFSLIPPGKPHGIFIKP